MRKITEKTSIPIKLLKIALIALSAVYCLFMPAMTGAGLLYNSAAYGAELTQAGVLFIVSAVLMSAAAVMCFFKKKILNILSIVFAPSGAVLCLAMLHRLCTHADRSGWTDKFTMEQISRMYERRILPCVIPVVLIIAVSAVNMRQNQDKEEGYTSIV